MTTKNFITIAMLLFAIAVGADQTIVNNNHISTADDRTIIQLNVVETNAVLAEMRAFLESVQQIIQGISQQNMELVAEYAKKAGRSAQAGMPATLAAKLPPQFKRLGSDTHARFDQLALDAEDFGDSEHALTMLSNLMKNCVACHAVFRLDIVSE
jgi:hypothetical protein